MTLSIAPFGQDRAKIFLRSARGFLFTPVFALSVALFVALFGTLSAPSNAKAGTDPKPTAGTIATGEKIHWQGWNDEAFAQAVREHKLVILDLEAVWCHWCHVMDEKTYADPKIIREIGEHFVAIRVDQDSRPDLSNRYEDYGWPATILLSADGKDLAKRSGFIEPAEMLTMLKAFVADPTPGPSAGGETEIKYASAGPLSAKRRAQFQHLIQTDYDHKAGGWKAAHKFLDTHLAEHFLARALRDDKAAETDLEIALDSQLAILDPVWGGFYQYSAEGDWAHPHFEKIISIQADDLKAYALALNDPHLKPAKRVKYLAASQDVIRFVETFLTSHDGAFFVSQDADAIPGQHAGAYFTLDDAKRRALGVPKVDQHIYARENGWMISSLAADYAATGDATALTRALRAADWIVANRKTGELFRHDQSDSAGPYLGDTVSMACAFLDLYHATADRKWLAQAQAAGDAMLKSFSADDSHPGLLTTVQPAVLATPSPVAASPQATPVSSAASHFQAKPQFEENFKAARFFNLLSFYTGQARYKLAATSIFKFLGSSDFEESIYASAALLDLDQELSSPPLHLVVSGSKTDPKARALFTAALAYPSTYQILEWWDKSEGPLPNPDSSYPQLDKAAAFVCGDHRCSFPAFEPADIAVRVKQITGGDSKGKTTQGPTRPKTSPSLKP